MVNWRENRKQERAHPDFFAFAVKKGVDDKMIAAVSSAANDAFNSHRRLVDSKKTPFVDVFSLKICTFDAGTSVELQITACALLLLTL